jgi:hypothetical protein
MNRNMGRIIARTLSIAALAQGTFGCFLVGAALLNIREAWRIMRESK